MIDQHGESAARITTGDGGTGNRQPAQRSSVPTGHHDAGTHLAGLNAALARVARMSPPRVGPDFNSMFGTIGAGLITSQVTRTTDIRAMSIWSKLLDQQFRSFDLKNVAGVWHQLTETVDAIAQQRATLNATMNTRQNFFGAQLAQITSSQEAISRLFLNVDLVKPTTLFDGLGRFIQVQASLGALATTEHADLLRGLTRAPGRRYDSDIGGLPARPIARRAAVAGFGGDAQSGMLIVESLTAVGLDEDDREELSEQYTVEVLKPWQTGPARAREDLFAALTLLQPDLPDWLKAAWEDIERNGPKAASKIANCTVECIDQTLRIVASVGDVMAWIADVGEQPGWVHDGRPTRRAKVMFVMRHRSKRDADLADSQVAALASLVQDVMSDLQSVKHGRAPTIAAMRAMVQAAEGALSQLLLHR